MGDRANVYIKEDEQRGVYLYTHWGGHDLPTVVQEALSSDAGRRRWHDSQYLARIIFCHMVGDARWDDETGYGISSRMCDNGHPIIVIDCAAKTIGFASEPSNGDAPQAKRAISIAKFCEQKTVKYPDLKFRHESP